MPEDVLEILNRPGGSRDGLKELVKNHVANPAQIPDLGLVGLLELVLAEPDVDVPDFLDDHRLLLMARPMVAVTLAPTLFTEPVSAGWQAEGVFQRKWTHDPGAQPASAEARNRWLALKLVMEVRAAFDDATPVAVQAASFESLAKILVCRADHRNWPSQRAEMLLGLTSLEEEPALEYREGRAGGWRPSVVGDEPEVWFFAVPVSFEEAKSDGERWRWALEQLSALGGAHRNEAILEIAKVMSSVFNARFLQGLSGEAPIIGRHPVPEAGVMALHTLDDDETVVMIGGRLRRLRLPPEFSFINHYKALALDEGAGDETRALAVTQLRYEWSARWQYDRMDALATGMMTKLGPDLPELEDHAVMRGIGDPKIRFESRPPQIAGRPASLTVTYRNVTKAKFSARKVDMRKVVDDLDRRAEAEEKGQENWHSLAGLEVHLQGRETEQWFAGPPVEWEAALPPADHHWDQQRQVSTPLTEAGLYEVQCEVGTDVVSRTLLWLDDIMVVGVPQLRPGSGSADPMFDVLKPSDRWTRYLVVDAITGTPVAGARLTVSGGESSRYDAEDLPFRRFERTTDALGSVVLTDVEAPPDYHWLMRVEDDSGRLQVFHPGRVDAHGLTDGNRRPFIERGSLFLLTDRPAYRPGEEVHWKAWLRHPDFDPAAFTHIHPHAESDVSMSWSQRNYWERGGRIELDDEGAASGSALLPDDGVLGVRSVHLRANRHEGHRSFPVGTFRKPEFVVEASAGAVPAVLGGTFEFVVKARHYSGAPLVGGMVRYHVMREPADPSGDEKVFPEMEWDWLYQNGYLWRENAAWRYRQHWGWGRNDDRGGEVMTGFSPLSADGTLRIPVETLSAVQLGAEGPQKYSLHAWVMDASQRQVELSAERLVHDQPCVLVLDTDRGFYRVGERAVITVRGCDADGAPIQMNTRLHVTHPDGSAGGFAMEEVKSGEAVLKEIRFSQGGAHRLQAMVRLPDGQEATAEMVMPVIGTENDSHESTVTEPPLALHWRNREHGAGDQAELLVTSSRKDAFVWLFVRPDDGVYPDPISVRLKNGIALHRIPVTEADYPNVIVQALTVIEGRVHSVVSHALVPPKHVVAHVHLETDKAHYVKGEKCRVKIVTTGFDGAPLACDVAFAGYDQALDAIAFQAEDRPNSHRMFELPDIRTFFWGGRNTHVQQIWDSSHACYLPPYDLPPDSSWNPADYIPWRYIDDAASAFASSGSTNSIPPSGQGASSMSGRLEALLKDVRWRKDLRDSIAWEPKLRTNGDGEAFVDFAFPENLTTWRLRAWAVGPRTEAGQGELAVTVGAPLELRVAPPRFLTERDEGEIRATVICADRAEQSVKAVISVDDRAVQLLSDSEQVSQTDTGGRTVLSWRVGAVREGVARIGIQAASGVAADALEIEVPVRMPRMAVTDHWDISLSGEETERTVRFTVPECDRPEETRLEVRLNPGPLSVIADAVPLLAGASVVTADQALNHALPALLAHRAMQDWGLDLKELQQKALDQEAARPVSALPPSLERWGRDDDLSRWQPRNLFDAGTVEAKVNAGLEQLGKMIARDPSQSVGSGWGWFGGSGEPNIPLTVRIVHGILRARLGGIKADPRLLQGSFELLAKYEGRRVQLFQDKGEASYEPDDLDALLHAVLIESTVRPDSFPPGESWIEGKGSGEMLTRLVKDAERLGSLGLLRLALACHQTGNIKARDALLEVLRPRIQRDEAGGLAWIEGASARRWNGNFVETQAVLLQLLIAMDADDADGGRVARWLISNRSQGRTWDTSFDTVAAIEALADYASATGAVNRTQSVDVFLDGVPRPRIHLDSAGSLAAMPGLVFGAERLPAGEHELKLRLGGGGDLAATFALSHHGEPRQPPSDLLRLHRRLYKVTPESVQANAAGIAMRGWSEGRVEREPIRSGDSLRSGELIEMECIVENEHALEFVVLVFPLPAGLQHLHETSGRAWHGRHRAYHEVREDRVSVYFQRLGKGPNVIRLLARVENAGRFTLTPATVTAMYAPAFHAVSGSEVVEILPPP